RRYRKKIYIISALVVICIIVAAVVGGVVGTRKSSDSQSAGGDTNGPSDTSSDTTTSGNTNKPEVNPTLIRPNSRLSVAGWRAGSGADQRFNIRLFYQGGDNVVRYSAFSSQFNWSQPTVAGIEAIPGGALAACANIHYDPVVVNLFYLDKSNRLKAQNFGQAESDSQAGTEDTTVPSFPPLPSARLSCYMPFVIAQESTNNHLRQFNWGANWNADRNSSSAIDGVACRRPRLRRLIVVMLPINSQYYAAGGFVYRTTSGSLGNYALDGMGDTKGTAWDATSDLYAKDISPRAPIAAFTVARDTSGTDVNTYILYQDNLKGGGAIQVVWQDDVIGGWKGPQTYPALGGADKDMDIACVTRQAWDYKGIWLKTVSPINRCYFQSQGAVEEVVLDGKGWQDLGFVPI
ncbi:hypothetical protein QBC37DRAFT_247056, partial [Rhypophila decipiens]